MVPTHAMVISLELAKALDLYCAVVPKSKPGNPLMADATYFALPEVAATECPAPDASPHWVTLVPLNVRDEVSCASPQNAKPVPSMPGRVVGSRVGAMVGVDVGAAEGTNVGTAVGVRDGLDVGAVETTPIAIGVYVIAPPYGVNRLFPLKPQQYKLLMDVTTQL